jgi:hypothetical protein
MSNVIYVRPQLEGMSRLSDIDAAGHGLKAGINRLLACARADGLENTAMMLELALTAVDVDLEERRR